MKLLLLLAILLILIALAKTSPSINKYRIVYPYKQFQIFDNQIYILIHVPENLQAANENQIKLRKMVVGWSIGRGFRERMHK